jgi:hypothetical protein
MISQKNAFVYKSNNSLKKFLWAIHESTAKVSLAAYKAKRGNRSFIDVRTGRGGACSSRVVSKTRCANGFYANTSHLLRRGDSRIDRKGTP